jgi:hypothetical protein
MRSKIAHHLEHAMKDTNNPLYSSNVHVENGNILENLTIMPSEGCQLLTYPSRFHPSAAATELSFPRKLWESGEDETS